MVNWPRLKNGNKPILVSNLPCSFSATSDRPMNWWAVDSRTLFEAGGKIVTPGEMILLPQSCARIPGHFPATPVELARIGRLCIQVWVNACGCLMVDWTHAQLGRLSMTLTQQTPCSQKSSHSLFMSPSQGLLFGRWHRSAAFTISMHHPARYFMSHRLGLHHPWR